MRKMTILMSAATGYVLGARAGRARYEQICSLWSRVSSNPQVQQAAGTISTKGSGMAHSVVDKAAEKAPGWMPGSRDAEESTGGKAQNGMPAGMTTGTTSF